MNKSCLIAKSRNCSSSSWVYIPPVGLLGLQIRIPRVLSVTFSSKSFNFGKAKPFLISEVIGTILVPETTAKLL